MPLVFDAEEVEEKDRAEYVRAALASSLVPVEVHWPDQPTQIVSRAVFTEFGDVTLCSGRSNAVRSVRTPAMAKDSTEPYIFVNLQVRGTSLVAQEGREIIVRRGDLVVYNSTSPYTIAIKGGLSGDCFRIPHSSLALPHEMIRRASAVALCPGHPIAAFAFDYLRRVAADPQLATVATADLLGCPSIELVRAVITTHVQSPESAATSLTATLSTRVLEYTRANLHDCNLNGDQIAAAHHISVRHLYKVMAENGISLADWIRSHRLEAARRELAHASADVTIATIARRNGFSDMSSFSRAFRSKFGLSPREWRHRDAN